MARRVSILDLPVEIRERICEYAGLTGFTRDLNYANLDIYYKNEYPETEYLEVPLCFHDGWFDIIRREDYRTLEEYWEVELDRCEGYFTDRLHSRVGDGCGTNCEMSDACADCFSDHFYDFEDRPELFRIMVQKNHLRICQGSPGGFKPFFGLMMRWVEMVEKDKSLPRDLCETYEARAKMTDGLSKRQYTNLVAYYADENKKTRVDSYVENWTRPPKDLPMTYNVLHQLGTLTVRLDGEPPERITMGEDWLRLKELIPYNLRSRYGKSAMKEWKRFVKALSYCIAPDRLTLYVIMNAPDVPTAGEILKPLDELPTLKGCGLFLNYKPIEELTTLAKSTVERLTRPKDSKADTAPFRYGDLPQELRNRILEFSDLVSSVDLEWKPPVSNIKTEVVGATSVGTIRSWKCCDGYVVSSRDSTEPCECYAALGTRFELKGHLESCAEGRAISAEMHRRIDERQKSVEYSVHHVSTHCCNEGGYYSHPYEYWPSNCTEDALGFCVCYLSCRHSSYKNTVHRPRSGPHPLFLVSRQVYRDAISVFFRRNRFVIAPISAAPLRYAARMPGRRHQVRRAELSVFLTEMPPHTLRYIRYLEWTLPWHWGNRGDPPNYSASPSKAAYQDYLDAIDMMGQAMNLSQLTLVVNFRGYEMYDEEYSSRWLYRVSNSAEFYDPVLGPLRRLEGLKDCFIYLKRLKNGGWSDNEHWPCVFDYDEMRYEKAIMGPDYNSHKRGKPWTERYERIFCTTPCKGHYEHYRGD